MATVWSSVWSLSCCSWSSLLLYSGIVVVSVAVWRYIFVIGRSCKSKRRLDGKTAIVTGANTGIGKETALDFAKRGARVIVACRDETKAKSAIEYIKGISNNQAVVFKKLDLASLDSVHQFSQEILQEEEHIHILVNNAGVFLIPYALTQDGFEMQFGVNHLGHFLLTNLLLDRIKESAPSRIVNVSSIGHIFAAPIDFNDEQWNNEKNYNSYNAYTRSKLANVMFTRELAKRLEGTGVSTYSLHPGAVNTEVFRHVTSGWKIIFKPLFYIYTWIFTKTPTQGAQTTIHCAVSEECEGITGKYWIHCVVKKPNKCALIDEDCKKLWDYSVEKVKL